jgi:undecaprenyl-diphosphatase
MGGAVSFAVGLLSLWWLIRWLRRGKLHWFAWWVFAAGAAVLVWQFYWPVMAASEGP